MCSGAAPPALTCSAQMWSSDRPVGTASNFPALLADDSVALGVTGWQVKYDPHTCVYSSFFWPSVPSKLHSFMARMPRTMSSLSAYGAMGASVRMAAYASRVKRPCDSAGNQRFVRQPQYV